MKYPILSLVIISSSLCANLSHSAPSEIQIVRENCSALDTQCLSNEEFREFKSCYRFDPMAQLFAPIVMSIFLQLPWTIILIPLRVLGVANEVDRTTDVFPIILGVASGVATLGKMYFFYSYDDLLIEHALWYKSTGLNLFKLCTQYGVPRKRQVDLENALEL